MPLRNRAFMVLVVFALFGSSAASANRGDRTVVTNPDLLSYLSGTYELIRSLEETAF